MIKVFRLIDEKEVGEAEGEEESGDSIKEPDGEEKRSQEEDTHQGIESGFRKWRDPAKTKILEVKGGCDPQVVDFFVGEIADELPEHEGAEGDAEVGQNRRVNGAIESKSLQNGHVW